MTFGFEFSFYFLTSCLNEAREPSLPYYLLIEEKNLRLSKEHELESQFEFKVFLLNQLLF